MASESESLGTSAVLSILLAAKEAGAGKLTRTALMKHLYLLDLFVAEETGGRTWTGASWHFLHFGPFAQSLADDIASLSVKGLAQEERVERDTGDYFLYSLGEWSQAKSMEALGVPRDARMRCGEVLRQFATDLPALLNVIYFGTDPMRFARPGDELDFSSARKLDYKVDVKLIKVPVGDAKKIARMRELARIIAQRRETESRLAGSLPPIRDALFEEASLSDEEEAIEGAYTATLVFEGD